MIGIYNHKNSYLPLPPFDLPLLPHEGDVGPDLPLLPVGEVGPDFPLFPVSKRSSFMPIIYTRIQRIPMMMKHFGRRYNMRVKRYDI